MAQAATALIEAMGMHAENEQRKVEGKSMAYTEEAFSLVIRNYGIHHNAVLSFYGGN